jgi:hypothetical protein
MNGFINSPALAKLVALQMVDEQVQRSQRTRPRKAPRPSLLSRVLSRRPASGSATPVKGQRVSPSGKLAEER